MLLEESSPNDEDGELDESLAAAAAAPSPGAGAILSTFMQFDAMVSVASSGRYARDSGIDSNKQPSRSRLMSDSRRLKSNGSRSRGLLASFKWRSSVSKQNSSGMCEMCRDDRSSDVRCIRNRLRCGATLTSLLLDSATISTVGGATAAAAAAAMPGTVGSESGVMTDAAAASDDADMEVGEVESVDELDEGDDDEGTSTAVEVDVEVVASAEEAEESVPFMADAIVPGTESGLGTVAVAADE